eukprot:Rmarinus@m.12723
MESFVGVKALLSLFLWLGVVAFVSAQEPIGCGGFVSVSPDISADQTKFDFTSVRITLETTDGFVKDSVECTPNGYYFLSVYDTAGIILRASGPAGWTFEPSSVAVTLDEDASLCDSDINFVLSGFTLSGSVRGRTQEDDSCIDTEGPAGVTISLYPEGEDTSGDPLMTTKSDSLGHFHFAGLKPGHYEVLASHDTWTLTPQSQTVDISLDSANMPSAFRVDGFTLSGSVLSGGEPMRGAVVYLFSNSYANVRCKREHTSGSGDVLPGKTPLCSSTSDATGTFSFQGLPCGTYTVVPQYYGAKGTPFDISPRQAEAVMGHKDFVFENAFHVTGFSVGGRVVDGQGKGIADVTIALGDVQTTVTDADGKYKLDSITAGMYTVTATAAHMAFEVLEARRIDPSVATLPDIHTVGYSLCGTVSHHDGKGEPGRLVTCQSTHSDETQSTRTDSDGSYCFIVPAGEYVVKPISDSDEVPLQPLSQTVTVAYTPVLHVDFGHARVSVHGRVRCIVEPCPAIPLALRTAGDSALHTTSLVEDNGAFVFKDVTPGKYTLEANVESWCWQLEAVPVDVGAENVEGVVVEQKGFVLEVWLSHESTLSFRLTEPADGDGSEAIRSLRVSPGTNELCLHRAGVYEIHPSGSYRFEHDTFRFDTSAPKVLRLEATEFVVTGSIQTTGPSEDAAESISVNLIDEATGETQTVSATLTSDTDGVQSYRYEGWFPAGTHVLVRPTSSELLFAPRFRQVEITPEAAPPVLGLMEGRPGVRLAGSVTVNGEGLGGVLVTVEMPNGEPLEVETDQNGSYTVGSMLDSADVASAVISARKDGYAITPVEGHKGKFTAVRMAEVVASVTDTDGKPLEGVLISLSGFGFRNNMNTQADGTYLFQGLPPGDYFLRPVLKEYEFSQSSQAITIGEGERQEISFIGKRVAFSAFGSVLSLAGAPIKGLVVDAIGTTPEGGYQEATTDEEGNFRIRGLLPSHTYTIAVKSTVGDVERCTPASLSIAVGQQDVRGLQFLAFARPHVFPLRGVVDVPREYRNTIQVSLRRNSASGETVGRTLTLGPSPYFEFADVAPGKYVLVVTSALSKGTFQHGPVNVPVEIVEGQPPVEVSVDFSVAPYVSTVDASPMPYWVLVVTVALAYVAYNRDTAITMVRGEASVSSKEEEWIPSAHNRSGRGRKRH